MTLIIYVYFFSFCIPDLFYKNGFADKAMSNLCHFGPYCQSNSFKRLSAPSPKTACLTLKEKNAGFPQKLHPNIQTTSLMLLLLALQPCSGECSGLLFFTLPKALSSMVPGNAYPSKS